MTGDISGCHSWGEGGGHYLLLGSGAQGCFSTFYRTAPPIKNRPPQMSIVGQWRNHASSQNTESQAEGQVTWEFQFGSWFYLLDVQLVQKITVRVLTAFPQEQHNLADLAQRARCSSAHGACALFFLMCQTHKEGMQLPICKRAYLASGGLKSKLCNVQAVETINALG